jgi:hypothetical protein
MLSSKERRSWTKQSRLELVGFDASNFPMRQLGSAAVLLPTFRRHEE